MIRTGSFLSDLPLLHSGDAGVQHCRKHCLTDAATPLNATAIQRFQPPMRWVWRVAVAAHGKIKIYRKQFRESDNLDPRRVG